MSIAERRQKTADYLDWHRAMGARIFAVSKEIRSISIDIGKRYGGTDGEKIGAQICKVIGCITTIRWTLMHALNYESQRNYEEESGIYPDVLS